jgi:molybdate transport system regulatory protein
MNSLPGNITAITTENEISLVKVKADANGLVFTAIVIDTPEGNNYLTIGHPVRLLFKETEVMIAKTFPLAISVQNRIECVIKEIAAGRILCDVTLEILNNLQIHSIITRNACEQLSLQPGDKVTALIKTNEVTLSHD